MGINYPLINSAKEELKGYKVANLEALPSVEALSKASKFLKFGRFEDELILNFHF